MAITEKQLAQASATTSPTSIFSPPSGTRIIIKTILVANNTGGTVTFSIFHDDDGTTYSSATVLFASNALAARTTREINTFITSNTSSANFAVAASVASSITFSFYGAELT